VETLPKKIQLGSDRNITFHIHPKPVRVAYRDVLNLLPQLYKQYPNVDYFIHVGVHGEEGVYRLEKRGRKTGYDRLDVDGKSFEPRGGEELERWRSFPQELWADVKIDQIVKAMKSEGHAKTRNMII
jgi:hypothetical protein